MDTKLYPNALAKIWTGIDFVLRIIVTIVLFLMMMVTFLDVTGRYVFAHPIPGGFEIVQYLMALVVMASLPVTTASEKHITVSIFTDGLKGNWAYFHRMFVLSFTAFGLVLVAVRLGLQAKVLQESSQVSGYLGVPLHYVAYVMACFGGLAAVVIMLKLTLAVSGKHPPGAPTNGSQKGIE
jgi:TRAP-type transport system small permease protein